MSESSTNICDICETQFDEMTIRVLIPIFVNGNVRTIHLCRECFLKTDSLTASELLAALGTKQKGEVAEP